MMGKKKKKRLSFRDRILKKINFLPEEEKRQALMELEVHEYCSSRSDNHTVSIRDIPHPLMKLNENGDWAMGWE